MDDKTWWQLVKDGKDEGWKLVWERVVEPESKSMRSSEMMERFSLTAGDLMGMLFDEMIGKGKIDLYRGEGSFEGWLKRHSKEQAAFPEQVAYYHGCYVNYNFPQLGKDLVKVLNALGVGVQLLDGEKCCGIAMITNGMSEGARKNANHNIAVLEKAVESGLGVIATSSTCTLTIREEYPELLGVDNSKVKDSLLLATRYIFEKIEKGAQLKFRPDFHMKVAYHTPCHMEKLGWGVFSEKLLRMIPGVEFTLLDSNCCGIAGTYGFKKENYLVSQAIGAPLFEQIKTVNPDVVACDCETCKWQIEMSAGYKVMHPVSILAQALDI